MRFIKQTEVNGCFFQHFSMAYRKISVDFCLYTEKRSFKRFYFKFNIKSIQVLLKNDTRNFQNSTPFERSACFYATITENFKSFQQFNFSTDFPENENLFKKLKYRFSVERTRLKTQHFHAKMLYQKPMLRKIEYGVQNGRITNEGVLPAATLFF